MTGCIKFFDNKDQVNTVRLERLLFQQCRFSSHIEKRRVKQRRINIYLHSILTITPPESCITAHITSNHAPILHTCLERIRLLIIFKSDLLLTVRHLTGKSLSLSLLRATHSHTYGTCVRVLI